MALDPVAESHQQQLLDDLEDSAGHGRSCDTVTLSLADGEINIHSFPLAASSSVFRAMLRYSPNENYKFNDITVAIGKEVRCFLYTRRLKKDSNIGELLVLADKYLIDSLKDACVCAMINAGADEKNWGDFLRLGDLCHSEALKELGVDYFLQNAEHIMKTPGWDADLEPFQYRTLIQAAFS
jgi:BTB/POZ domain